jgi:hypothetical protein
MSRHEILYSNETKFYGNFSKFPIFNSFEEIGIHLHTVFEHRVNICQPTKGRNHDFFDFCQNCLVILC